MKTLCKSPDKAWRRVCLWASRRGIGIGIVPTGGVELDGSSGCWRIDHRSVYIAEGLAQWERVYVLLHELGHYLISCDAVTHPEQSYRYGSSATATPRSFAARTAELYEEFDAWYRGWELARDLRIEISVAHWRRLQSQCLKTSMILALETPGRSIWGAAVESL